MKTAPASRGPASERASVSVGRPHVGGDAGEPMRRLQQALGNRAMATMATARQGALAAARHPARPLDPAARREMEDRFGVDLGSVRVRTDPAACDAVRANAYTVGENIVFNAGRYAPQLQAGRVLLAHELTHVVQQRRGAGSGSLAGLESEAHGAGRAAGFGAGPIAVTDGAPVSIARDTPVAAIAPPVAVTEVPLEGTTTVYIDRIAVLRFPTANAALVRRVILTTSDHPDTIFFGVSATSDSGARVDQAGLDQLSYRHTIIARLETRGSSIAGHDGGLGADLDRDVLPPSLKPPKPVAKLDPPPRKQPPAAAKPAPPAAELQIKPPVADTASPRTDPAPQTTSGPTQDGELVVVQAGPAGAAPLDLSARLATIRDNLKSWTFNISWKQDIANAFKDLSPADFQRLQDGLTEDEMNAVFDQLPAFYSTLIGTYGPVVKGRDKLNQNRVDFIENIRNWGSSKDVFSRWAFASMSLDDMRVVLAKLADDKRLHETVLAVEGLADNLQARGIAPSELTEEDTGILQGVGRGLGHVWDSAWSSTVFADGPSFEYSYLPKNYQELYVDNLTRGFEKAATLSNITRGAASNVTLGLSDIPFGVYDASKLTVEAAGDAWAGRTGAAAEKLTPVVVMLLAALAGRRIAKMGAPPAVVALEESKALAPIEGAAVADHATPPAGGGAQGWEVRKVGRTAEGADIHIARHPSGELIEIVVDPKTQTVRATHLGTREVVTYENGQYTRGTPPQLTAGEGAAVSQPPQAQISSPLSLPAPRAAPLQLTGPAAPLQLNGRAPPLQLTGPAAPLQLNGPATPLQLTRPAAPLLLGEAAIDEAAVRAAATRAAALPTSVAPVLGPRATAAAKRLAQSQEVLARVQQDAAAARQALAAAEGDLAAARELAGEQARPNKAARDLVRENEATVRRTAEAARHQAAAERVARLEDVAVSNATREIERVENDIARLEREITAELNPRGGFDKAARDEGRRGGIVPSFGQKSGAPYRQLTADLRKAKSQLAEWEDSLTRSVRDRVNANTPGADARPSALLNAETLSQPLRPVGGLPIDVTTGRPIQGAWSTDHIMSRVEISSDPRFYRLDPIARDAILLDIPENYLPITAEANSSKGGLSVSDWISARARSGRPLPTEMATALRTADIRARAAIEAFFKAHLPP